MASINATTSSGIVATADNTGTLQLQSAGTTVMTITSTGVTTQVGAPAFSAYMSAGQSVSNATYTKLQCNTEQFDTASCYDTTNYRFTPTIAGYYQVNTNISGPGSATGILAPAIYKNGSYFWNLASFSNTAAGIQISASILMYLNGTTDYIEFYVYQTTGGAATIAGGTGNTVFQASLARSA